VSYARDQKLPEGYYREGSGRARKSNSVLLFFFELAPAKKVGVRAKSARQVSSSIN
jgi:hypothetical protein